MIIGYRVLCCFELQASGLSMLAQVSGPCPKGVHLRSISKKEFTSALFFLCRFLSWLLPSLVFRWKSLLGKESKRIHLQLSMDLLEGAAENLEVPNALNLESFMSQSTQKTYRLTFE